LHLTIVYCLIKVSDKKTKQTTKKLTEKMFLCTESCYMHDCWNNNIMVLILHLLQLKSPLLLWK